MKCMNFIYNDEQENLFYFSIYEGALLQNMLIIVLTNF